MNSLRSRILQEEVCHWGWGLRVWQHIPLPVFSLCFRYTYKKWAASLLPLLLAWNLAWKMSAKINSFFCTSLLVTVFVYSNRKGTNSKMHPNRRHTLPWAQILCGKRTANRAPASTFPTVDAMWAAASCSCCRALPTMIGPCPQTVSQSRPSSQAAFVGYFITAMRM